MKRTLLLLLIACGSSKPHAQHQAGAALSIAADERMVAIPAGNDIAGSTPEERASAYDDYQQTSGNDVAREAKWFDIEEDRRIRRIQRVQGRFRKLLL
jgi:hypothetical protein